MKDEQYISIHAPAGGATYAALVVEDYRLISIHAPAGGATRPDSCLHWQAAISIHAPAGGATAQAIRPHRSIIFQFTPLREGRRANQLKNIVLSNFNSRPCGRGDAGAQHLRVVCQISIHAPAGGATRLSLRKKVYYLFQFTPLREGRQKAAIKNGSGRVYFNSRPCGRGDGRAARLRQD